MNSKHLKLIGVVAGCTLMLVIVVYSILGIASTMQGYNVRILSPEEWNFGMMYTDYAIIGKHGTVRFGVDEYYWGLIVVSKKPKELMGE